MDGSLTVDRPVNLPNNRRVGEVPIVGGVVAADMNGPAEVQPPPPVGEREPPLMLNNNHQFGQVRDRLFHVLLVRLALNYARLVPRPMRRLIEFLILVKVGLYFYRIFVM